MRQGVNRSLYHCLKCDWTWLSSLPQPPRWCPSCHCANWDQPKRAQAEPSRTRIVFPFHDLAVGQSVLIPWPTLENGQTDPRRTHSLNNAIRQEERLKQKKFYREGRGAGLHVTRVS